jgi:hypothetical protein
MLKSLLNEPLVHFLLLTIAIFAAYFAFNHTDGARVERIVVTRATIEQLASRFTASWQRPPTTEELKGLVDDNVKEEIYYREALALGLDKNDALIRRRLRQKMEFLIDAEAEGIAPTEAELETYLKDHAGAFAADAQVSLQQVFLNPQRHADATADAAMLLTRLRADQSADPSTLGDTKLLPSELPLTDMTAIQQMFGGDFATGIANSPEGQWIGPIASAFGLHLVRVTERKTGGVPKLDLVRAAVAREWANDRRKALEAASFQKLVARYQVVVEPPPSPASSR